MKAWLIRVTDSFEATIVFAETRGKAKSIALETECCDGVSYIDITARRMSEADQYYKDGKKELDWLDDEDRLVLVKELGFVCEYPNPDLCAKCVAKKYCEVVEGNEENEV